MRHFARPIIFFALLFKLLSPQAAQAQSWDSSGNSMLSGTYFFREVILLVGNQTSNLSQALTFYGKATFDGAGGYNFNGSAFDSSVGVTQVYNITGTYVISSSGFGYINRAENNGGPIIGLVSNGVFIGSSTDNSNIPLNNLFVAVKAPASPVTTANVNGSYWISHMNYPSASITSARDAQYTLTFNGAGGVAPINANGFIGATTTPTTQTVQSPTYNFVNDSGNLFVGGTLTASNLLAGNYVFYVSADGNVIVGGSATGFDMFVGVLTSAGDPAPNTVSGTFYQAGIDQDETSIVGAGYSTMYSYYGAFNQFNSGLNLGHQRTIDGFSSSGYDYTYELTYSFNPDNTFDDYLGYRYRYGAGGAIRIGQGRNAYLGLNIALKAPSFSGPGVYINPTGVVNAASSAPFTVGVSRGMFLTIYGTGLASTTLANSSFPTTLGGVIVLINNKPAPIYFVSANQISVIVPYSTPLSVAIIQVINNGVVSNVVTSWVNQTTPGIFTMPPGGVGYAAALHPDYSIITPTSPAQPGETVAVFLTGLGDVTPAITEGTPGPSVTLSNANSDFLVTMQGTQGPISFKGLAPFLIGMYQLNFQIPATATAGDLYINIAGPDSFNSEARIPVAAATENDAAAQADAGEPLPRPVLPKRYSR